MCLSPEGRGVPLFPAHQAGILVYYNTMKVVSAGHIGDMILMRE